MSDLGDAYKKAHYMAGGGKRKKPTHRQNAENLQREVDGLYDAIKYKNDVAKRAVIRADKNIRDNQLMTNFIATAYYDIVMSCYTIEKYSICCDSLAGLYVLWRAEKDLENKENKLNKF